MSLHKVFILREERNAQALWAWLKNNWRAMAEQGNPVQVTLSEEVTTRSLQANKRYWAILRIISDTGWIHGKQFTSEAWHHYFRLKFLPHIDGPDGLSIPVSTTTLSSDEFGDYMTQVEAFAGTELGIDFREVA